MPIFFRTSSLCNPSRRRSRNLIHMEAPEVSAIGETALPKAGGPGQQAQSTSRLGSWGGNWTEMTTEMILGRCKPDMAEMLREDVGWWKDMEGYGRIWKDMEGYGRIWKDIVPRCSKLDLAWQIQRLDEQNAVAVPDPQLRSRSAMTCLETFLQLYVVVTCCCIADLWFVFHLKHDCKCW